MFLDEREIAAYERNEEGKRAFALPSTLTISILLHVGLAIFFIARAMVGDETTAFPVAVARMAPRYSADEKLNVRFYSTPEKNREAPKPHSVASDVDSRAHGGDRSRPLSTTPFSLGDDVSPGGGASSETPIASRDPRRPEREPRSDSPSLLALRSVPPDSPRREAGGPVSPVEVPRFQPNLRELIRSGAVGPPGEGGSGPNESDGGLVDEGGLSFDTRWFEWGPYAAEMIRRIRREWRIPDLARVGMKGVVVIRFFIRKDGTVVDETILKVSGVPPFDNAAFQAIAGASPLPPLPLELASDREGVTITFLYNVRPDGANEQPSRTPNSGAKSRDGV